MIGSKWQLPIVWLISVHSGTEISKFLKLCVEVRSIIITGKTLLSVKVKKEECLPFLH